jgi:hypothetical protein
MHDDALRAMLHHAISTYPPRLARVSPHTDPAEMYRAEGAYRAYLRCIALALGGYDPASSQLPETTDAAAWWALRDDLDTVLAQAIPQPDDNATLRAVRAVAAARGLQPHQPAPAVVSMQERILTVLGAVGYRAGLDVSRQPDFANTGHLYYTARHGLSALTQVAYRFDAQRCELHLQGPAIDALGLHDSPPRFRYIHTRHGWRLSFWELPYGDGERITVALDLLARALAAATTPQ